jgi:hypothetical protein
VVYIVKLVLVFCFGTKMYLKEMYWDGVNWADLSQDKDNWWAVVSTAMSLLVTQN